MRTTDDKKLIRKRNQQVIFDARCIMISGIIDATFRFMMIIQQFLIRFLIRFFSLNFAATLSGGLLSLLRN